MGQGVSFPPDVHSMASDTDPHNSQCATFQTVHQMVLGGLMGCYPIGTAEEERGRRDDTNQVTYPV